MNYANALTNKETALLDLYNDIKRGYFCIPSFQRGVVWTYPDICRLGDSVLWGYPISSLLLMPTTGALDVARSPIGYQGALMAPEKTNYVLDGQQRITAIAKLFIDDASDKAYYFDLLTILAKGFEDGLLSVLGVSDSVLDVARRARNDPLLEPDEYVCRGFKVPKTSEIPDTKKNHRYLRCKTALESGFGKYVVKFLSNYFKDSTLSSEKQEELIDAFTDYLTGLLGGLKSYGVPVTMISEGSELELVCSVFERVNSSGIKLTTFDLVNAKTFESQGHKGGLGEFLRESFNSSPFKDSLISFFEGSASGASDPLGSTCTYGDLARVPRILYLADKLKHGQVPELSNAKLLKQKTEFWYDSWADANATLIAFVHWAETSGLTACVPRSYVDYMAAVAIAHAGVLDIIEFQRAVTNYGLSLSAQNQSFTKSNLKVVIDFSKYASQLLSHDDITRQTIPCPQLSARRLTADDVLVTKYSSRGLRYAAILDLMYGKRRKGLFGVDLFGYDPDFSKRYSNPTKAIRHKFEEHHLIPKATTAVVGYDSLANIVVLGKAKNNAIGGQRFENYVNNYHEKQATTQGKLELIDSFERNMVPRPFIDKAIAGASFTQDDYATLLRHRAAAIADYINDYFGFGLQGLTLEPDAVNELEADSDI